MRTGRRWAPHRWALALTLALTAAASTGCARRSARGDLAPPPDAAAWDGVHDITFDDHYTETPLQLSGRAPGDVVDQRRLAQRLGYADLVMLVTVEQVWSRGLHDSEPRQRLDVKLGKILLGVMPRGTRSEQTLELRGGEALPAGLTGRVMLLFVRWAPGEGPGYHHHLMPADDNVVEWIEAMTRHARKLGKLQALEKASGKRKRRRGSDPKT